MSGWRLQSSRGHKSVWSSRHIKGCNQNLLVWRRKSRLNLLNPSSALQICDQSMIKPTETRGFQTQLSWKTLVLKFGWLLLLPVKTCLWCRLNCFAFTGCMHHVCDQGTTNAIRKKIPSWVLHSAVLVAIWQAVNNWDYSEPTCEIRPQHWNFTNYILYTDMPYSSHGRIFISQWNTVLVLYLLSSVSGAWRSDLILLL